MRRAAVLVTVVTTCLWVGVASAQCAFRPGNSGKLRVPLMRAYDQCGSGSTSAEGGIDACSPVQPPESPAGYGFGLNGDCRLETFSDIEGDCS